MSDAQDGEVDLSECDREPIHIPGAIQPHGVLLSLGEPGLEVFQVSDNTAALLGPPPGSLLGRRLGDMWDHESLQALQQALVAEHPSAHEPLAIRWGERRFDGLLHRHAGATLLELEPVAQEGPPSSFDDLHGALARIQAADDVPTLLDTAVREVQRLTGYERVLAYRFHADGHGEVAAEVRAPDLDPYLGLRYPASDIPAQARALYRLNPVRLIPDARYEPAALVPPLRPDTGEPLDLSHAILRSVSPVHREYMHNMGVRASMSLSLLRQGNLWGLLGCLHRAPHHVPFAVRARCEVLARATSLQITALQERHGTRVMQRRRRHLDPLVAALGKGEGGSLASLGDLGDALMALVDAAGVAVCVDDEIRTAGKVPSRHGLEAIRRALDDHLARGVFHTSHLGELAPELTPLAPTASGVLAVQLPRPDRHQVLWFRPEMVRTVAWGGDPNKPVEAGPEGRLRPRRSFQLWKETVRATAHPWLPAEIALATDLRRHAIEADLRHQVQRANRAVQARDDMAAVVAHDLRVPLSTLRMQADLLQDPSRGPEAPSEAGQRIGRAVDRMARILDDLLDVAHIEAGRLSLRPRPVRLRSLVELALDAFRPEAAAKGVSLGEAVPGALRVEADDDRLLQVLSNLLTNALRHTESGGRVTVAADRVDDQVRVTVADTGVGIAPEAQPHLFVRGWQQGSAQGSAGLGLFICQGIVEAHGGTIWVESDIGKGARFHFTLPAVQRGRGDH